MRRRHHRLWKMGRSLPAYKGAEHKAPSVLLEHSTLDSGASWAEGVEIRRGSGVRVGGGGGGGGIGGCKCSGRGGGRECGGGAPCAAACDSGGGAFCGGGDDDDCSGGDDDDGGVGGGGGGSAGRGRAGAVLRVIELTSIRARALP